MKHLLLFFLLIAAGGSCLRAQLWSGILAPPRAVDWSTTSPGVVGGVPSASWTQCGSTIGAGASASTIQSALNSCSADHYVLLGPGTFNLSTGLNMQPNVVLRGSGANSTFLVFSNGTDCGGLGAQICFLDSSVYYSGSTEVQPGGTNAATFCGTASSGACNNTYAQGSTTIQLSSIGSSGIVNGQFIYLDQANDNPAKPSTTWASGGMLICDNVSTTDGCSLEGGAPGRTVSGVDRNMIQIVKVVSGCTSACKGAGPFSITISPGIYGIKWASSYSPGAWWSASNLQNAGLENLSMDSAAVGTKTQSGIYFYNAFNCWVSGIRSMRPNRNHVWLYQSAHDTIQNSYFFGTQNAASESYGVESFVAGDNLVINNIFQQVVAPITMGPSMGSVFAYNFSTDDLYTVVPAWMQAGFAWLHDAGILYNLSEGNLTSSYVEDAFHGSGGANTVFRNYAVGWESGKSENTCAVELYSYNRFENYIGNVLGCNNTTASYPGNCGATYHNQYQTSQGDGSSQCVFDVNEGDVESPNTVKNDPYVSTSLLRWGNYDVANASVRWVNSEIPSGLKDGYANPVPSTETIPASLWLTSKPAWWGSVPWPPIGPDVTGGNIPGVGGHAYLNPAANCYLSTMGGPVNGSGSVLTFNASNCYTNGPTPGAPQNLNDTVVLH